MGGHDKSAGIQIEIIGTGDDALGKEWNLFREESFGEEEWIYLAKLLVGIGKELAIPMETSVEWENPVRFSPGDPGDKFKNTTGIVAHMHVPDNDHTDTGNIWPMLEAALEKVGAGSGKDQCGNSKSTMIEGGLTLEQAQKIAEYYRTHNGGEFHVPLPNSYYSGDEKVLGKWNCVSMSRWFTNEFTDATFGEGNGKDVAANLRTSAGLEVGSDPQPWSIFGITKGITVCPDGFLCGHTGVVVGVHGDKVIIIEAAWGQEDYAAALEVPSSYFVNDKYPFTFAYFGSHFKADRLQQLLDSA